MQKLADADCSRLVRSVVCPDKDSWIQSKWQLTCRYKPVFRIINQQSASYGSDGMFMEVQFNKPKRGKISIFRHSFTVILEYTVSKVYVSVKGCKWNGKPEKTSILLSRFCENPWSCNPQDLVQTSTAPTHTELDNCFSSNGPYVPYKERLVTSSKRLEQAAEVGLVRRKKFTFSQFGVESLRFTKKKKPCDGVFEGCLQADGSIQWGAICFYPIFALHRWVVVQISLSFSLSAFSSGESLAGRGLIWQSPS